MSITELLKTLEAHNIQISEADGKLKTTAPKGAISQEIGFQIKANKQALLEFIERRKSQRQKEIFQTIKMAPPAEDYPLSFAQQRLWFIDRMEGSSSKYNMPSAFRLRGRLDIQALERCFNTIVERHQVLRTTFIEKEGNPRQCIGEVQKVIPTQVVLTHLQGVEQEAAVKQLVQEEAHKPFDLSQDLMLRYQVLKLAEDHHIILFTMHHIASDGWSLNVLVQEILALYGAFTVHASNPMPRLPIQYVDFACWERWLYQGEVLQEELSFWQTRLKTIPLVHNLPLDKPRPPRQSFKGHFFDTAPFSVPLYQGLKNLCQQQDVTFYMLLQTAFAVLLGRYSNQNDIVLASPVAGRSHQDLDKLIGFFVNSLVFRINLDGNLRFTELLSANKQNILETYSHQKLPFEMVVEAIKPERSLSHSPIFQIMFALQNNEQTELSLPSLKLERLPLEGDINRFDLELSIKEYPNGLAASWAYNTDLFFEETVRRMAQNFEVLLESIVANPNEQVLKLNLLADSERSQQLMGLQLEAIHSKSAQCVHNVFQIQAEKHPHHTALIHGTRSLSYQELEQRANQFAHLLLESGVNKGSFVGLYLERSHELMVGILAILKIGAVYVPLDPDYPESRIAFMMDDSDVQIVVTRSGLGPKIKQSRRTLVCLDANDASRQPTTPPGVSVEPSDLAYVIYTSGSMGQPKGVLIEHGHWWHCLNSVRAVLGFNSKDCLTQIASPAFDIALLEQFLPLVCGGSTLLVDPEDVYDMARLIHVTQNASCFHAVPSLMDQWLEALDKEAPNGSYANLKTLLVGGEATPGRLLDAMARRFPKAQIIELYGPTENTIVSTYHRKTEAAETVNHCIGRSFPHVTTLVLNEVGELAPIGVVGELYLGGPAVARGYLNRPTLSSEKFIQNPLAQGTQERLYRTGDLVRRLPDGNLEFMGRLDHQVKLRGFRIELEEIENQIARQAGVKSVLVNVVGQEPDNPQLVAYLCPTNLALAEVKDSEGETSVQVLARTWVPTLREALMQQLPKYMVPSAFVVLPEMPLTAHGKIDRDRLPLPEVSSSIPYRAATTETEFKLQQIWQELLGKSDIGMDADFFELGGHSLLAIRMISSVRATFGCDLSVRAIFERPTIAGLCEEISNLKLSNMPALKKLPRTCALPLSFAQQRLWFIDQLEGASPHYNMPGGFRLKGHLALPAFKAAMNEIVRRHEILRTVYQAPNGIAQQVVKADLAPEFRLVDAASMDAGLNNPELRQLIREDAEYAFDLTRDAMLRVVLVRLAEDEHLVLLNMHHIASDGWSVGIVIREFVALYQAFSEGKVSPLAPLSLQYADFAQWQRTWFQGEVLEEEKHFWRETLQGLPRVHSLPLDKPRPLRQQYRGRLYTTSLGLRPSQAIQAFCSQNQVTLFMFLETAFAAMLARFSGEADVVLGTPIAGRNHREVEPLIGFFVNSLVLRTQVGLSDTFSTLLAKNKQTILEAFSHQHIPFEMLVEELNPDRSLSHSPLFQIMFSLQTEEDSQASLPGFSILPLEQEHLTIRFDLELSVRNTAHGLSMGWFYNVSLFEQAIIEGLASCFEQWLTSILERPDQEIAAMNLLSDLQRDRLLQAGQPATGNALKGETLLDTFRFQVERAPHAIAVVDERRMLDYASLDRRSNQVANALMDKGVGPEVVVGLFLERSPEWVIAMLAVLKAGGAFVPLDTDYPIERLKFLVDDSAAAVVLTTRQLGKRCPAVSECLFLDDMAAFSSYSETMLAHSNRHDRLAYLVYTSGSQGQPKGVLMELNSLSFHLGHIMNCYGIVETDHVLQFTNIGFDPAIEQTFTALLAGAKLYLRPSSLWQPGEFNRWLAENEISTMNLPPSYAAAALPDLFGDGDFWPEAKLRQILIGGETFPVGLIDLWRKHGIAHQCRLVNVYGPTEACITSYFYEIPAEGPLPAPLAIGIPVDGTGNYVLDERLQLTPDGVMGELYLGGPRLARGYLNSPDLTAAKFVVNPFQPKLRLYRTGDLVRRMANGNLQFLGRVDDQIKHRGFRIEPGEIESQLCHYEGIRQAHVRQCKKGSGGFLVAYLVATEQKSSLEPEKIRAWVKQRLPDYMVPAVFVLLSQMPLTANGKVDAEALPEPEFDAAVAYTAPGTQREKVLVAIWENVLRTAPIGIHDNFFALGGDSILTIQVVAAAKNAGLDLTTKALFENQTIAELALVASETTRLHISQAPVAGTMPLLPIQQKFLSESPVRNHFNQSILLETPSGLNVDTLSAMVLALYDRHDALRLRFERVDGEWQVRHQPMTASLLAASCIVEDLPANPENRASFVSQRCDHWQKSFNLAQGPLFRAVVFLAGTESSTCEDERLFLVAHHLVVDGVSWRVLLADLEIAFEQSQAGKGIKLAPKSSSFQEWGQALAGAAETNQFTHEKPFWLNQLKHSGSPLPLDVEGSSIGSRATSRALSLQLTKEETKALLQKSNSAYRTTINELLLAATYLGMRRWTQGPLLRIGLEGHGREAIFEHLDVTQTLGWFTTLFPLALNCTKEDVETVILGVKEQYRAIPNKGIGYGILRYLVQDEDLIAQETMPMLLFNYLGQFDQTFTAKSKFNVAQEEKGEEVHADHPREYPLELTSMVVGDIWRATLVYSVEQFHPETMENLRELLLAGLKDVIRHCTEAESTRLTPADFPLAMVDQAQLDVWQKDYRIECLYPVTPMQAGMIFHSLMDSAAYTNQTYPILEGNLDQVCFRKAWNLELQRHDVFRTAMVGEGDALHQLVVTEVEVPWYEEDWRDLSTEEQQLRFETYRLKDKHAGFRFEMAPLMRMALFRLTETRFQMLWTVHHSLVDGWCLPLVYREVMVIYHALREGAPIPLEPAARYQNYIAWLHAQEEEHARSYWREQLQDIDAATGFSIDKLPNDGHLGYREQILDLSQAETQQLRDLAKSQKTTMNNLLMLSWGYLLHRYSGDESVVFGTAISGRPAAVQGVGEMIGLFVNTIPVKMTFPQDQALSKALASLGKTLPKSQEMGFLSLAEIQKLSNVPKGTALFDSVLALDNYPMEAMTDGTTDLADLKIISSDSDEQSNFKLALNVSLKRLLSVKVTYRGEDFADAPMVRLLGHFRQILTQLPEALKADQSQLEILTKAEHQQLLAWNQTARAFPQDRSIRSFFQEAAAANPDAPAVISQDSSMSYRDLNARANRIAHFLVANGAKPNSIVGIFTERSIDAVVAMVAVLKAGAAFLPISNKDPEDRIKGMLEDAEVRLVLTQNTILESFPLLAEKTILPLDSEYLDMLLAEFSENNPDPETIPSQPQDLAYVIYTSGSTGIPKGVMCHQLGFANLCFWHERAFALEPNSRGTQMANLNFDASVWEIWPYLLASATVVIVPDEVRTQPSELADLYRQQNVTHSFLTTGLFESMARTGLFENVPLKYLLTGGDRLSAYRIAADPGLILVNNYGPTEVAAVSTWCEIPHSSATAPPIGHPVDNLQVHVLNRNLEEQPIGVAGELYIGGMGVAKGYLNQPDLTREAFVDNPFRPGEKLYKTGDLGRRLENGDIAFISRVDGQVKLRGFRIEIGEIEVKLNAIGFVEEAVVVIRGEDREKRILAYVVVKDSREKSLIRTDLKKILQEQLPEYMIPAAFVLLDQIPLTPSGKIDREALPEPDYQAEQTYSAPRTPAEKTLATIWEQVLRVPKVGIYDNFFEIGGDSILSIQISSRAKQAGLDVSTKALFTHPTIAAVAEHCQAIASVAIPQEAISGEMPLLPVQAWFLAESKRPQHYNQAVLLVAPEGFHRDDLRNMVHALYMRHDALRLRFLQDEQGWTAVHRPFNQAMVEASCMVETLPDDTAAGSAFVTQRCNYWQARFDLTAGPLIRAVYFKSSETGDPSGERVFIVLHHIVVDGVSWRILLADLEQAFRQGQAGQTVTLAQKTSSFKQWGEALAQWAKGKELQQQKEYWLNQTRLPVTELPVDMHPLEPPTIATSAGVAFGLNEGETQALLQKCNATYHTTINELLLAGVFVGLRQWTGGSAFRLVLEGHGRDDIFDHLDTTQTLGWFTAIYPLRLACADSQMDATIKSVKEHYRAIPSNGLGYGVLRYLAQDPDIAAAGKPSSLVFNYLGQFDQTLNEETQFKAAPENSGHEVAEDAIRSHRLGLNGKVFAGKLQFTLNYSQSEYHKETVIHLAKQIEDGLRAVIAHCMQPGVGSYTPSDFPLARVNQAQLDRWQENYPEISRLYPATPMQAGMLFHSMLDRSAYATQTYPTLKGPLNVRYFWEAWAQVIQRYDAFRTIFVGEGEELHQLVLPSASLTIHEEDWRAFSELEQKERFEAFRKADKMTGFNFQKAPLMRLSLFRLGAERYQLLWTLHHIVADGWSFPYIYKEVIAIYHSLMAQQPLQLKPPAVYENYIAWLMRQDVEEAKAFWKNLLAEIEAPTPLVVDKLGREEDSGFGEHYLTFTPAETKALQKVAGAQQTTINTLLQLAWAYLLHRYSGENHIVFGTAITGRPAEVEGIEEMVGLFINTIPVKVSFNEQLTLREQITTLHHTFQESMEKGYLSLVEITRQSKVPGGTPLFDSALALNNYPIEDVVEKPKTQSDLHIEQVGNDEQTTYKLTLVAGLAEELQIWCSYRNRHFTPQAIERMLGHLGQILRQMPGALEQSIQTISILTESERLALASWNQTQTPYPHELCLHELFEAQVERSPEATALVFEGQQLSYRELNEKANQLAHFLVKQGVGPDCFVGLSVERSFHMMVGLLGILKAGGAYVPIDPTLPEERIHYIFEDSGLEQMLTQKHLVTANPILASKKVLLLDDEGTQKVLSSHPTTNLPKAERNLTSANLIYLIYTSGTTGEPKGVMIEHRGFTNVVLAQIRQLEVTPRSRLMQFASLSFDASITEIAICLLAGATLCIPKAEVLKSAALMTDFKKQHQLTHVTLPPAFLPLLNPHDFEDVKHFKVAGDACPMDQVRAWSRNRNFYNGYGPTEVSVGLSVSNYQGGDCLTIGRPMANKYSYIVDRHNRLQPVGIPGEILIGGVGLARGYLNRPDLTAEKFVDDPIAQESGKKVYRTGDIARYLPNGEMEFLGRIDDQVKVRGFRVELGEIESQLLALPGVREAVVLAREGRDGEKQLVAYVVGEKWENLELWPSVSEWHVLDDVLYRSMQENTARVKAYSEAFRKVLPGKTVLEVGPGSELALTHLCIQAGASRVYAVEIDEEAYRKAQKKLVELGLEDKVTLMLGDARTLQLPEKVDYCISALVGAIGGSEGAGPILNGVRHHLKEPACMIPQRSTTRLAAVELANTDLGFSDIAAHYVRQIFAEVGEPFDLRVCLKNISHEDLLSSADVLEDLDYRQHVPDHSQHAVRLEIQRSGMVHGLLAWLTVDVDEREKIDILKDNQGWLPVFFPMAKAGIRVEEGEAIRGTITRTTHLDNLQTDFEFQLVLERRSGETLSLVCEGDHRAKHFRKDAFYRDWFSGDGSQLKPYVDLQQRAQEALKRRLPHYMVPSAFVKLDRFPLNPNGKIDKKALPEPDLQTNQEWVPAETKTEQVLTEIWQEVLKLEQVGITQNFFALGGHSLLATQMIGELRHRFNLDIPLQEVFDRQTIQSLAAYMDELSQQRALRDEVMLGDSLEGDEELIEI